MVDKAKPGERELRSFGLIFGLFSILVFAFLIPLIAGGWRQFLEPSNWPLWPWVLGAVSVVLALIHPVSLRPLHRLWMRFAEIAGWINSRIIMVLLFFVIIMPIGLVMRLFGYDPMRRKFEEGLESYRIASKHHERSHVERPY